MMESLTDEILAKALKVCLFVALRTETRQQCEEVGYADKGNGQNLYFVTSLLARRLWTCLII